MSPSFKLMAKAVGVTTEELDKMMQQGKLFAKDVLPEFGKNLREFAAPGLDKALKSNRVAMNKFMNEVKFAAEEFFKGGFGEGLTDLFNSLNEVFKENKDLWSAIGKIIGSTLKAVSGLLKIINPFLVAFGTILKTITDNIGVLSALAIPMFTALAYGLIPTTVKELKAVSAIIGIINKKLKVMKILSLIGMTGLVLGGVLLIEEGLNQLSDNPKDSVFGTYAPPAEKAIESANKSATIGDMDKWLKDHLWPFSSNNTPTSSTQSPVTINTQINMDGELLAQNVTKTNAFASAVDRQSNSSFTQGV